MQGDDSIGRGHRKRQVGKGPGYIAGEAPASSAFPEIGGVEATHGVAFVISHKQANGIGVLDFLFKQEVNVLQGGWSAVNIISQENQLIVRFEMSADNLLRGFEVTMSVANENDFAGFQLDQLGFRGKPLLRLVQQFLCCFSGHRTELSFTELRMSQHRWFSW
jgi:hypothetical protein